MAASKGGRQVKALRKKLGLSQQEMADALAGVSLSRLGGRVGDVQSLNRQRIYEYESGTRSPGPLLELALAHLAAKAKKGRKK